ncbi:MAG: hypothetical protein RL530_120, partial [Actinomycetota bacterium]
CDSGNVVIQGLAWLGNLDLGGSELAEWAEGDSDFIRANCRQSGINSYGAASAFGEWFIRKRQGCSQPDSSLFVAVLGEGGPFRPALGALK